MYQIESRIVGAGKLLPGIHGLRGIAAVAVVLFHLVHIAAIRPPGALDAIGRYTGYAVHLFFIVSAFSLMHSTVGTISRPDWIRTYFIKRFFRIAPLFYAMVAFEAMRQAVSGHIAISPTILLLNLGLVFGLVPSTGIVWGGWSVGVEVIFYALFPVILVSVRSIGTALLLTCLGIVVSFSSRITLDQMHGLMSPAPAWNWTYFAFSSNLAFFLMGVLAFLAARRLADVPFPWWRPIALATSFLLIVQFVWGAGTRLHGSGHADVFVWGIAFTGLCVWQRLRPSALVANRAFEFLGERSFSLYLTHPVIIHYGKPAFTILDAALRPSLGGGAFFVVAAASLATVMAISELTYRWVEVPGISLGRKLAGKK